MILVMLRGIFVWYESEDSSSWREYPCYVGGSLLSWWVIQGRPISQFVWAFFDRKQRNFI